MSSRKEQKQLLAPVAIDFGAKHTGVYYAKYEEGSKLGNIEKEGEILEWGNYTALLKERTKFRHIRRNYQRRRLAKKLLVLVLKNYFDFPAHKHTQALAFFINRRGFNRLENDIPEEILNEIPKETLDLLPKETKDELDKMEATNLSMKISDPSLKLDETWKPIQEEIEKAGKELKYWEYLTLIEEAISKNKFEDKKRGKKLSKFPKEVLNRLAAHGVEGPTSGNDYLDFLETANKETIGKISSSLGKLQIKSKLEKAKGANFCFELKSLTEKEHEDLHNNGGNSQLQLKCVCLAIEKVKKELDSGSRHRETFFKKIRADLEIWEKLKNSKDPKNLENLEKEFKYLKKFNSAISENQKLDIEKIYHLIAHISNF